MKNQNNAALIIVDMQKGVIAQAHHRDVIISNINTLVEKARKKQIPVIWVQHSDDNLKENSPEWEIVSELRPASSDTKIYKNYGDSFEDTNLGKVLENLNVGKVFITGAQTDACIRATLHGAFVRGYDTTLISDAHTTEDLTAYGFPPPEQVIHFTNTYWTWQAGKGKVASVIKTEEF